MKKKLRIILITLAVIIVLPFAVLFVLSLVHHQSAHDEFVDFLNHEFEGAVTFNNFKFSYIRHFPNAHIQLKGVSVKDDTTEVLKIGQLDIIVNTLGLWQKKISLRELIISDAAMISVIDSLGNKTKILAGKTDQSDSIHKALLIEAQNIKIRNSRVYFENQVKNNRTGIHINSASLDAEAVDSILVINGKLDGKLDSLISNNSALFANQPVKAVDVCLHVNRFNGYKELKDGYLLAHTLKLIPRFTMKPHEDGQVIELHISGEDNFDPFLDLFEFHTGFDLQQTKPEARLKLSYNQNGFVNPFHRPYSELDFEISGAEFAGENLPFPVEVVEIKGNYNNGEGHSPQTVELIIDTIDANVSESFVRGRFKLSNLKDPYIDAHIAADLDISHLVKETRNIRLAGSVDFDLSLTGKISELRKLHLEGKQTARGEIHVDHLELILNEQGYAIELINGASLLDNHILEITTLIGTFNESAFHFEGELVNLDQYILNEHEDLVGKFALNIDEIDLTRIHISQSDTKNKAQPAFSPFSFMALEFIVNAKKIITGQGDIKNLKVDCRLHDNAISLQSVVFDYQDGQISGSGDARFSKDAIASLNASLNGKFNQLDLQLPKREQEKTRRNKKSFHWPEKVNVKLDLDIRKGTLAEVPLKNLHLSTHFNNNELKINRFDLDAFGGHSEINGRILMDSTGIREIQMNANLHANSIVIDDLLNKFSSADTTKSKSNKLSIPEDVNLSILLNADEIYYKDAEVTNLRTKIKVDNDRLDVGDFYAGLPFGHLAMDISAANYRGDQTEYNGWVDLMIDTLAIDQFTEMNAFRFTEEKSENQNSDGSVNENLQLDLPKNINLKVTAKAGQLSYKHAVVNDLDLLVEYLDNEVKLEKLRLDFAGGTAKASGYIYKDQSRAFPGYLNTKADSLRLDQFFSSFNNFNQQVFTAENTQGKISWSSHYYFSLGNDLVPRRNLNFWIMNFIIHETKLIQVKPIEDALFFVGHKAKDTMFIKRLNVNTVIDNDKLFFRDVMMNNNIANLNALGIIDLFKREMDIGLEISLSDLFFRTKKGRNVQTREGTVNLENDAKIYLDMSGPLNDHKINLVTRKKFNNFGNTLVEDIKVAEMEFKHKQQKQ